MIHSFGKFARAHIPQPALIFVASRKQTPSIPYEKTAPVYTCTGRLCRLRTGKKTDAGKSGAAVNEYTQVLRELHETYLSLSTEVEKRTATLDDTEKQRAAFFLSSAFDLVVECYLQKGDPADPQLSDWMSPYRKFAGDNPQTIYTQFPIDHQYSYVLKGKLGNAIYFGVQAYGYQAGFNLPTSNTDLQKLQPEKDGSIILHLSANRPDGVKNWMPIAPGDHAVLLRQYFDVTSTNVPATLSIARTDQNPTRTVSYLDRLEKSRSMITDYINGTLEICDMLRDNATNDYPKPGAEVTKPKYGGALYPTKDNRYNGFWVSLKPGEAIHLHGTIPSDALYTSYVFYDRWYNTPDYRTIRCFRTNKDVQLNPDGTFDLYISPETIDHPNWINTGGLYEGSFSARYLLSASSDFPKAELVRIADIPN